MAFNPLKNIAENAQTCGIELFGNKRILIFDCKCVVDYCEDYIVIDLGNLYMKVRGSDLVLSSFSYGQTDINGEIVSVEFEKNK